MSRALPKEGETPMHRPQLIIMAAGLGSRFGGMKQIAPLDEAGHLIIDYSIFDALRAGFEEVVIIVKPEHEGAFEERIGRRIRPFVQLRYAHQALDMLPSGFSVPEGRQKPWGTGHALLCAKEHINAPFAVINADDFYGREAYQVLYDFLAAPRAGDEHAMVSYLIENTLSDNGSVARGVCSLDERGNLAAIQERTGILPDPGGATYPREDGSLVFVPRGTVVSLNFWGFQPSVLQFAEEGFLDFLRDNLPTAPLASEYFLPGIPDRLIREGRGSVRVLTTGAKWYGVTYRGDMPFVQEAVAEMRRQQVYPERLWA